MTHLNTGTNNQVPAHYMKIINSDKTLIPSFSPMPNFTNAKTLEEEVNYITVIFFEFEKKNKNLTEIHTGHWYTLGELLNKHREHVVNAGHHWSVWAEEHFPFLKKKRREQCMELASIGPGVKPLFYMGIDRLYDITHKLHDHIKDTDYVYVKEKLGFIFKTEPQTDMEKKEKCKKVDQIREFYKFKNNVKHQNYYIDLIISAILVECTFTAKDYQYFNDPNNTIDDISNYIVAMIVAGSSPTNKQLPVRSPESINVILAKLIQAIDNYISSGNFPEYLETIFVDEAINKLIILKQNISI